MAVGRPPRNPWAIPTTPLLARSAHDRLAHRRTDPAWLAQAWEQGRTRVLVVSADGTVPAEGAEHEPSLALVEPAQATVAGTRVLLGEAAGVIYFALLADQQIAQAGWRGLRELGAVLTDLDVGLLTSAVALGAWHRRHPHCPRCGALTLVDKAGWSRVCPIDSSEHFPRTDPAVIMLVHDGAGRCVLARGPQWGPGRMSVLAGFVEAGESAEAAVAREVAEEVGIAITDIRYEASQPHPFPASLMLGYTARVTGDPTLRIDADEIVEAGWFTREQVRASAEWADIDPLAARGSGAGLRDGTDGASPILRGLPSTMSIARQMINTWLAGSD